MLSQPNDRWAGTNIDAIRKKNFGLSRDKKLKKSVNFKQLYFDRSSMLATQISDMSSYDGGSICNENPFITPPTNALGIYAKCQTKDQRVAVIMVHETLFYLSKFNKLHTF